jgi:hypothetical protein
MTVNVNESPSHLVEGLLPSPHKLQTSQLPVHLK